MNDKDYKRELEKFSKQVIKALRVKAFRGCEYNNWQGFCNGLGEDIGEEIENLIRTAENNLK